MKIILANFKSNKNLSEIKNWLTSFRTSSSATVVLCPPFPFLPLSSEAIKGTTLKLGVQDLSMFPAGAYTGAVGTKNLEDLGVSYAILGHSERRRYFHETNNDIANKVREAIMAGIKPVICVTKDVISQQAHVLEPSDRKKVMVAFEPVEHIGTGISDSLPDILKTKELVTAAFGDVPYIYGGSVDRNTDPKILRSTAIDGFLVGGASLNATDFAKLVATTA